MFLGCGTDDEPSSEAVAITEVFNGFEYYGACGNESVQVGPTTYYPLFDDERAALDTSRYPTDLATGSEQGLYPLQRIAEPGPGDDVGTLLVYRDGMARFESDSGRIIWLSDDDRTYNWEC